MPSGMEWVVILAVVVILFGGKKIPELAKGIGQGIKNFKKEMKEDPEEATDSTEPPKQVEADTKTAHAEENHTPTSKQA